MEVDLTNSELFKSFAEFEQDGIYIDLHNEFDCKAIELSNNKKQFIISFKPNKYCRCVVMSIEVVFDDCIIKQYSSKLDKADTDLSTLYMMYRGRFETGNGQVEEISDTRGHYYYINFLPDIAFELFAKRVVAKININ
jgi:hypothetical protein